MSYWHSLQFSLWLFAASRISLSYRGSILFIIWFRILLECDFEGVGPIALAPGPGNEASLEDLELSLSLSLGIWMFMLESACPARRGLASMVFASGDWRSVTFSDIVCMQYVADSVELDATTGVFSWIADSQAL